MLRTDSAKLIRAVIAAGWLAAVGLIAFLSMISAGRVRADGFAHSSVYAILMVVPALLLSARWTRNACALGLFMLSACVELGQAFFTTTRTGSFSDLACNGGGILLGYLAAELIRRGTR